MQEERSSIENTADQKVEAPVINEKLKASVVKYEYDETGNVLSESSYINDFSISELSSLRFAKRTEKEYDYLNYTITEKSGDITTVTFYNYLDKQGRILLPQNLREYAELDKEITMVGTGPRIEIWDKKAYDEGATYDNMDDVAEHMGEWGFGI